MWQHRGWVALLGAKILLEDMGVPLPAHGRQGFNWCARQGALTRRCKSSTHPARGSVSRTARVFIARWDPEEAGGKALL